MYITTLFIHSWLRYLVLGFGLLLLFGSASSLRKGWSEALERLHVLFMAVLDVQMLLGILLYLVLSPIAAAARANMAIAMKDPTLRFFGMEHIVTMLIAVVIAHVGRARSKKKGPARSKTVLIFQCVWLLLTLAAIPWPGLDIARPLFRM